MRAVSIERFVAPSEVVVKEVPEPTLGAGEVLIDVVAAGCNFFDTLMIQGKYQLKPPFPFSPGGEVAGVVREVSPGETSLRPGDRVFAHVGHGGFAERLAAPARAVQPLPQGMSFEEGAAFPIVYGTAYAAVVQRGGTRPGDTLLVTAAAGGVGLAAVQIGKAVGARVVGLASGDKLGAVREAGADVVIDYRAEGWPAELRAAVGVRGADVVVENVGGEVWEECTRVVGWGGRLVVVGFSSGKIPEMKLNRVLLKHISVVGLHFGPMREHQPDTVKEAFSALSVLHALGKIRPTVSRVLPLSEAATALELLGSRGSVGKLVLSM